MRRREFITLLGGAAATWPMVANAQQPTMPVVGFLGTTAPDDFSARVDAFRKGLKETGYLEGQNVVVEYRWAEGKYDRLATLAADLVRRQVTVIAAVGGEPSPLAAKAATSTIPIVFIMGTDPVKLGLVTSLNRPEGNITGLNFFQSELGAKRLGLVRELLPEATVIGVLVNPNFPDAESHASEMKEAAYALGMQVHVARARTTDEFDSAFSTLAQQRIAALLLANDAYFLSQRQTVD
jgi:putative ABC transport system substrate-binding protein